MTSLSLNDVKSQGSQIGFFPDNALSVSAQSAASPSGIKSPKHSSKEFIFDVTKTNWGSIRSNFWIQESVDIANDSGVYVEIENFDFKANNGFTHPQGMIAYIKNLASLGVTAPKSTTSTTLSAGASEIPSKATGNATASATR